MTIKNLFIAKIQYLNHKLIRYISIKTNHLNFKILSFNCIKIKTSIQLIKYVKVFIIYLILHFSFEETEIWSG